MSKNPFSFFSNFYTKPTYATLFLIYLIIIVVQVLYTKYRYLFTQQSKQFHDKIKFNKENYEDLFQLFEKEAAARIDLLTSGKMKFREWANFMNQQNTITYRKNNTEYSYYFFLWEKAKEEGSTGFIYNTLAHNNKTYADMSWEDVYKDSNEMFVYVRQSINPNLIKSFFELSRPKNQQIKYFWADPMEKIPVQKVSLINVIPERQDEYNEMMIGIGIDVENLNESNILYYSSSMHTFYLALISLTTFLVSMIFYIFSSQEYRYKSFLFLILSNLYLLYFLSLKEYIGTPSTELTKIEDLNNSMLSASFLVGINTYILQELTTTIKTTDLFIQSALIFAVAIILLLIASFKITDSITLSDLITDRLSHQLVFNFSVLLNIVLVLNYFIFVLRKR